eukprot:740472-Rhodomonas_salina.2
MQCEIKGKKVRSLYSLYQESVFFVYDFEKLVLVVPSAVPVATSHSRTEKSSLALVVPYATSVPDML